MTAPNRTMRDVLIEAIDARMAVDPSICYLTADLGAPALDALRAKYPERCINVGIAEQNLIAVAAGLALEGFSVFAYGIAPFISMRAYEQTRSTVALLSATRELNVNIVSLGAGFSYDVSGPTHQCIEDLPLMRLLPGVELFSPSDSVTAGAYVDRALSEKRPKYLRLDGKPLPVLYSNPADINFDKGFHALRTGGGVCLVTTGHATHIGLSVADQAKAEGIEVGLIDLFLLKNYDAAALAEALSGYKRIYTVEESLIRRGGLDSLVLDLIADCGLCAKLRRYGPADRYLFVNGGRGDLHRAYGMDAETILKDLRVGR